MRKIICYLIACSLSCSLSYGAAHLGADFSKTHPSITVISKRGPADNASLRPGDVILEINNVKVPNTLYIQEMLLEASMDEIWQIKYQRSGRIRKAKIKLLHRHLFPEDIYVRKMLLNGENVVLVIVPLGINIVSNKPKELIQEYKLLTKNKMLGKIESSYTSLTNFFPNLSIVDRANIEELINEINFANSGFISQDVRTKMMNLLGATHIYGITYSKDDLSSTKTEEIWTRKLIEINSGKIVVASINEKIQTVDGEILTSNSWGKNATLKEAKKGRKRGLK